MDVKAVTTRRTDIVKVAQGKGLSLPLIVAMAQEEGKEDMGNRLRTCCGTKDIDNVDRHDQGNNGHVTTSRPFHLFCHRHHQC
jgi:hypothetical protein